MASDRLKVAQGQWVCDPNYVVCAHCDSLWTHHIQGFRVGLNDIAGAVPFMCDNCKPPTYFMAVFAPLPSPMVTCYPLSRDSYLHWDKHPGKFPPTAELLYYLRDPQGRSFNPYWRPPSHHRQS